MSAAFPLSRLAVVVVMVLVGGRTGAAVSAQAPDGRVIEAFLKLVSDPANQPVFVYCGSCSRAAALWYVKRVRVDGWTEERALAEAEAIGLTEGPTRTFVRRYVKESWR